MGRACLRRHRHSRPAGRPGGADPGRERQNDDPAQPDAAATDADPQLRVHSQHAVRFRDREPTRDADSNAEVLISKLGHPLRDGGDQRVADAMPVAKPDVLPVAERQPKAVRLALAGASLAGDRLAQHDRAVSGHDLRPLEFELGHHARVIEDGKQDVIA